MASAIKKEFKEDRVRVDQNLKITQKQIISYLEFIKDEEGRIPIDTESEGAISEENILSSIASSQEDDTNISEMVSGKRKRITISDLLEVDLVREGDNWRFDYKGEVA